MFFFHQIDKNVIKDIAKNEDNALEKSIIKHCCKKDSNKTCIDHCKLCIRILESSQYIEHTLFISTFQIHVQVNNDPLLFENKSSPQLTQIRKVKHQYLDCIYLITSLPLFGSRLID